MKNIYRLLVALAPLLLVTASCAEPAAEAARAQAGRMAAAFMKGDLAAIADAMYPGVVEKMGGRKRVLATLKDGMEGMKRDGASFKSVRVSPPGKIVTTEKRSYCLVPQTIEMNVPDGTLVTESHLLGISEDGGKTWTFLDTASWNNRIRDELFPDLGESLKIPSRRPPRLIRK